jgi:hypothetical protein
MKIFMLGIKYSSLIWRFLYFVPLFFFSLESFSQAPNSSCCPEIEQAIKQKDYQVALKLIREQFDQNLLVSGDILFFYGQTLLGLNEYVRANNAFEEYLKDEKNLTFRKQAQRGIEGLKDKICPYCQNTGFINELSDCGKCAGTGHLTKDCTVCKMEGIVACSVCTGKGILLKGGNMGTVFQECTNCKGRGVVSCKKCEGKKKYFIPCDICHNQGKIPSKKPCNHAK